MAAWFALALLMTGNSTAPQPTAFAHVRSSEARIREAILDGYFRSATFRKLVDAAEGLPCIVYVATAVKLPHDTQGALLHWAAGSPETPVLRVLVKNNLTPEEAIATVAHELQHVVEAATAALSTGEWNMGAAFDKLDPMTSRVTGVRKYETDAAVAVTRAVRNELRETRAKRAPLLADARVTPR